MKITVPSTFPSLKFGTFSQSLWFKFVFHHSVCYFYSESRSGSQQPPSSHDGTISSPQSSAVHVSATPLNEAEGLSGGEGEENGLVYEVHQLDTVIERSNEGESSFESKPSEKLGKISYLETSFTDWEVLIASTCVWDISISINDWKAKINVALF